MSSKPTGLAAFSIKPRVVSTTATPGELPSATDTAAMEPKRRTRGQGEIVALTVKVKRSDWRRLRQLADAESTTIQALAEAGLSAVLAKHGLPPLGSD